jgi:hypothetical protein
MHRGNIASIFEKNVRTISSKFSNFNKKYKASLVLLILLIPISVASFGYYWVSSEPILNIQMVSGTEYISGEDGQLIVRLIDNIGEPISGASCRAAILYPDKTIFITGQLMTESTEAGNYYYMFIPPSTTGIYEYTLRCTFVRNGRVANSIISHSFHVSPALVAMIQQLNETREQLESTRSELMGYIEELNESIDKSVENKINEEAAERDQKMSDMGEAIRAIFA